MSAAAPAPSRVVAQVRFETLTLIRNGEQLLVSMVLPLLALLVLTWTAPSALLAGAPSGATEAIDVAVPGVLALAVVSTAFTGQAIALGYERRYGVLRLLGTTPLGRSALLGAKGCAVLMVIGVQTFIIAAVGGALGWSFAWGVLPGTLLLIIVGTATFSAAAALLGGSLRAEAVLALANLVWVLLLGAGLLLPLAALPTGLANVLKFTPPGALGEGLRATLLLGEVLPLMPCAVLLSWAVVLAAVATRTWRWSD